MRLIVDYRAINKITEKDSFPFSSIRDKIKSIPQFNVFSQIDLKQGYH